MKRYSKALIATGVGVCLLSTAALASFSTGNGYDALKKAAWGFVESDNFTADLNAKASIDGKEVAGYRSFLEYDAPNQKIHSISEETSLLFDDFRSEQWRDSQTEINYALRYYDGEKNGYKYQVYDYSLSPNSYGTVYGAPLEILTGNEDSGRKLLKFMEAFADTVVGDLRNNFTFAGEEDGANCYQISLSAVQIPELISTGVSAVFAMNSSNIANDGAFDGDDLNNAMEGLKDGNLDSIDGKILVNKDGTLRSLTGKVNFAGTSYDDAQHEICFDIDIKLANIGTTVPEMLDISTVDPSMVEYVRFDKPTAEEYDEEIFDEEEGEVNAETVELNEGEIEEFLPESKSDHSIGVIGGADGPTSVVITR